jgi:hypothetical protein
MYASVNPLKLRVWDQQHFFGVDELFAAILGQFKDVFELNRTRWAGFLTEATIDTPKHIDFIPLGKTLARTLTVLICVLSGYDKNCIRGTCTSTKGASDALFHAIVIAV